MHDSGLTRVFPARRAAAARGFTILEIVVVLAVMVALAAFLAPSAFQAIQASRETATSEQLRRTFLAIVGDPSKGNFGYLGDMGRLPATLDDLVTIGSQVAWGTSHASHGGTEHIGRVGTGWRGPYLTGGEAAADLFDDPWGLPLSYTNLTNNAGQIVSRGPDGQLETTGDNITYPVQVPIQTTGTIIVTVVVNEIPNPAGLTVRVYSTSDGDQGTAVVRTTAAPSDVGKPMRFDVPHGTSAIVTEHLAGGTTVTRTSTVDVAAGSQVSRTIIMKTSATVAM